MFRPTFQIRPVRSGISFRIFHQIAQPANLIDKFPNSYLRYIYPKCNFLNVWVWPTKSRCWVDRKVSSHRSSLLQVRTRVERWCNQLVPHTYTLTGRHLSAAMHSAAPCRHFTALPRRHARVRRHSAWSRRYSLSPDTWATDSVSDVTERRFIRDERQVLQVCYSKPHVDSRCGEGPPSVWTN